MTATPELRSEPAWRERLLGAVSPAGASAEPSPMARAAIPPEPAVAVAYEDAALTTTRRSISPEVLGGAVQIADVIAILLSGLASLEIYLVGIHGGVTDYGACWLAVVLAATVFPFAHRKLGAYKTQRFSRLTWQVGRVALVWSATMSGLSTIAFITKAAQTYSRGWAILFAACSFAALALVRIGVSLVVDRWVREGRLRRAVAVVGAGELGQQVIAKLRAAKDSQVRLVGVFDDRLTRVPAEVAGCRVLGTTEDLVRMVRRSLIDEIVIALPLRAEARIGELVAKLKSLPVDLRLSLDPISGIFPMRGISETASIQMIEIIDRPLKHWSGVAKRVEDALLGALLALLLAPIMALIALAIRLDSRGPALFVQERFGFNNDVIRVLKFRTMQVERTDPSGAARTVPNDPRVTRVGRFLRRLSLDELPQLLNVLLGDMSLVGPRPHVMAMKAGDRLYHEAVGEYFLRHRVRPGMTGWAQVHGLRGEIDTPERARARVEYDLWYIDNWSLLLDLKILLMTVLVVLRRQNAY
jgi:Undecaprenyl-phosphate glucose phosphotransferase